MTTRDDLGLGRKAPPDRDHDADYLMIRGLPSMAARAENPPPVRRAWGLPSSALRHQGNTGTCTEHGVCHLVKAAPVATRSEKHLWPQFSAYRQYILYDEWASNDSEANGPVEGLQGGSSVRAAMKWLVEHGYASGYAWAFRREPASLWVRTRGPVVLGVNWYDGMFNLTTEGIAKVTGGLAGGHCFLWLGADERRGLDLFANSWDRWGIDRRAFFNPKKYHLGDTAPDQRGFFFMAAEDTERLIHEDGEAATATETRWKPKAMAA